MSITITVKINIITNNLHKIEVMKDEEEIKKEVNDIITDYKNRVIIIHNDSIGKKRKNGKIKGRKGRER